VDSLAAEGFDAFQLDVADEQSVAEGSSRALELVGGALGALINNAGYGQPGALEDISREALRRQFEANVFGLQDLTNRLLPAMRRAGAGRIVHISSVLGRVATPLMGAYCASKHAVEALADAQRVELRGTGVGVILIEPGPIETAFHQNARAIGESTLDRKSRFDMQQYAAQSSAAKRFTLPANAVARVIAHALESASPRARYRITIPAYVAPILRAVLPTDTFDRLLYRRLRNILRDEQ
jgi:NAD(P)-dependent dehydrogenase (short-subunit alcohol dehydrogenase family)